MAAREPEIGEELRPVNRDQASHGLDLDHDAIGHEEVDPIAVVDLYSAIGDRERELSLKGNSPLRQLVSQASFIDRLEQPGPELAVNGDRCANDEL